MGRDLSLIWREPRADIFQPSASRVLSRIALFQLCLLQRTDLEVFSTLAPIVKLRQSTNSQEIQSPMVKSRGLLVLSRSTTPGALRGMCFISQLSSAEYWCSNLPVDFPNVKRFLKEYKFFRLRTLFFHTSPNLWGPENLRCIYSMTRGHPLVSADQLWNMNQCQTSRYSSKVYCSECGL